MKYCRHTSLEKEMITQHLSIDQMKDSMRAPWIAGDFGAIAREIGAPEAEGFVARMELQPGARVLDIACGTGNVAIALARRGAMVTGLDMMPHLLRRLERARLAKDFASAWTKALPKHFPTRTPVSTSWFRCSGLCFLRSPRPLFRRWRGSYGLADGSLWPTGLHPALAAG